MQPPPRGFGFFTASLHEAAGHNLTGSRDSLVELPSTQRTILSRTA